MNGMAIKIDNLQVHIFKFLQQNDFVLKPTFWVSVITLEETLWLIIFFFLSEKNKTKQIFIAFKVTQETFCPLYFHSFSTPRLTKKF